jgi:hypothetical protein
LVVVNEIPVPVELWIDPPSHVWVAIVHTEPLPVTIRPPLPAAVPVLLRIIPFVDEPVFEMLRKVRLEAPIDVLTIFSAVAVVLVKVLLAPVTVMVPPPVALKPVLAPELTTTFEKLKVELVLVPVKLAPAPPAVVSPVKVKVPVELLEKLTPVPVVVVTLTSLTEAPVIAAAGSSMPVSVVELMLNPRAVVFVFSVVVPVKLVTVPLPLFMTGKAALPVGGVSPMIVESDAVAS